MISDLPSYDIFVPEKIPLLKIFDDVIAYNLWFGPPSNQKFWVRLRIGDCLKNVFKDLFFENTRGCVLGPWPRAFLSLASKGFVLGKAVLGRGFFFCVLGLEPCVLDSTSAVRFIRLFFQT